MNEDDPVLVEEQAHLDELYKQLLGFRDDLTHQLEHDHKQAAADLVTMSEEIRPDFGGADETMETLAAIETLNAVIDAYNQYHDFSVDRLRKVLLLLRQPYFAKVRLKMRPDRPARDVYIGAAGITDDRHTPLVVDWRNPIAETYYNQENGQTSYTVNGRLKTVELELRRQIDILVHFFRENLPGYEKCRCIASGATLGVRETRRVMGEYTVTAEELAAGKRFPDVAVHKAEFIVDIHNPEGAGQAEERIQYVMPYDLPYRCFVPLKVENLLTAGRCISGTHRAHASYRVMSICMAMGEAVGMAALCVREGCTPRTLDVKKLQAALESKGVDLYSK